MISILQEKFNRLSWMMNERLKRHWAACEALALRQGGISAVSKATGLSRNTIRKGIREIQSVMPHLADEAEVTRVRRSGGGRRPLREKDKTFNKGTYEKLLEATTRGDPERTLLWTCRSTRNLAEELAEKNAMT